MTRRALLSLAPAVFLSPYVGNTDLRVWDACDRVYKALLVLRDSRSRIDLKVACFLLDALAHEIEQVGIPENWRSVHAYAEKSRRK